jgi:hypothetical protein
MTEETESKTKIKRAEKDKPTILEVPPGYSAVVISDKGELDLALIPREAQLKPLPDGDFEANEGMIRAFAILTAMSDPDVNALVMKKLEEKPPPGTTVEKKEKP